MLTDSRIKAAKLRAKPFKLSDSRGLYLQVTPSGGRYWRFNYRYRGKQKTLALGIYPDVSLARARERHYEARKELAEGVDPGAAKRAPHVHVVLKATSEQGVRLNIKKAHLREWRVKFADHLRQQGVPANATPRQFRGQMVRGVLLRQVWRARREDGPARGRQEIEVTR